MCSGGIAPSSILFPPWSAWRGDYECMNVGSAQKDSVVIRHVPGRAEGVIESFLRGQKDESCPQCYIKWPARSNRVLHPSVERRGLAVGGPDSHPFICCCAAGQWDRSN